ncbi:MAG: hypothetical protein VKK04_14020 [Synechococcales bacterium]|nr:hypothetical protein [Synechococcales bacterium]
MAPAHADEKGFLLEESPPGAGAQPADAWEDVEQPRLNYQDWAVEADPDWCLASDGEEDDACWVGYADPPGETGDRADLPMDWIVDDEAVLKEDGLEWLVSKPAPRGEAVGVHPSTLSLLVEPTDQAADVATIQIPAAQLPSEPFSTEPFLAESLPDEPFSMEAFSAEPLSGELADGALVCPCEASIAPIWPFLNTDPHPDAIAPMPTLGGDAPNGTVLAEGVPQGNGTGAAADWIADWDLVDWDLADWDLVDSSGPPPAWDETNWDDPALLAQENLAWLIPQLSSFSERDRFDPYAASLLIDQGEQRRQASLGLEHWETVVAIAPIDIPDLAVQSFPDLAPPAAAIDPGVLPLEVGAIADLTSHADGAPLSATASLPLEWVAAHPADQLSLPVSVGDRPNPAPSAALLLSQTPDPGQEGEPLPAEPTPEESPGETPEDDTFYNPEIKTQAAYLLEGDDSSARGRVTVTQIISPSLIAGATVDLTGGNAFSDSREEGLSLNELYLTASLPDYPNLRFTVGLMDLTSYFDRNSFAKDAVTHFFNSVFQTNPALSASGIASRPGLLVRFDPTDFVSFRAATFSSTRDLGDFELDGFAGEMALRAGTAILRATYVTAEDEGEDDGFREIFQFNRGGGNFGLRPGDREEAFGLNGEVFIPDLNMGLFARFGRYNNLDLDEGGTTFSFGFNLLDLFLPDDRLGLGYGRQLSNNSLRRDNGDPVPDVLELFYDIRLTRNLRFGVMLQQRDGFSETVAGLRIRADFDNSDFRRIF